MGQSGSGHLGGLGAAQGFLEHGVEFQRQPVLEIEERGGFIGTHLGGVLDHLVGEFKGHIVALGAGGGDDFEHEFVDEGVPARVGEEEVGGEAGVERTRKGTPLPGPLLLGRRGRRNCKGVEAGGAGDAQAIEGDVPDEFFPAGFGEGIGDGAGDTGMADGAGDIMGARFGPAVELAHDDLAVGLVIDDAGFDPVQADEAEAAEDLFGWKYLREGFFVAQAVLQGEDGGAWANERR